MTHYAFHFDGSRCTGCKTCALACKDYHDLGVGTAFRKVYEVTLGDTTRQADGTFASTCASYPVSVACGHCADPACVRVCPTRAMGKDEATGLVAVDEGRCDGCAERVGRDLKPVCVEACPARALDFGSVEAMRKRGDHASIAPLPPPAHTRPSLFVKPSADARPAGDPAAAVVNPLEVI